MSMTDSEAIEVFRGLLDVPCEMLVEYASVATEEQKKALVRIRCAEEMAITALREIQQYRAIGTVEDIKKVISFLSSDSDNSITDDLNLLNEYRFIGTVSEFEQLKEKATAKKAEWIFDDFSAKFGNPYRCSNCDEEFGDTYNYCPNCGCDMYAD